MTKLLAFLPTPRGLTGGPRRLLTLAACMKGSGIKVIIASKSDSDLLRAASAQGVETVSFDTAGTLGLRRGALLKGGLSFRLKVAMDLIRNNWRVAHLVRQYDADVVWLRGSKGFAFAGFGAFLSGRPIIWDVDGEPRKAGLVGVLLQSASRLSRKIIVQYSSAITSIFDPATRNSLTRKTCVLAPGIELERMRTYKEQRMRMSPLRQVFRIIQVGAVCENKNQTFSIDVLSRLESLDEVELLLVGGTLDKETQNHIDLEISKNVLEEQVVFCGWRDDVHDLIARADLLIMPSKDEGIPNAVQEAMAIGVPVIVSDAGGMPEIVSHGETGWILPLADPEAWARQIDVCRHEPSLCATVGNAAAAYAAERFGTEMWGREYARIIHGVVGRDTHKEGC